MKYKDQSHKSLNLTVLAEKPIWSDFTVLRKGILKGPFEIEVAVIGESHIVSLTLDSLHLTEIFSCSENNFLNVFVHHPFSKTIECSFEKNDVVYSFISKTLVLKGNDSLILEQTKPTSLTSDVIELQFDFPVSNKEEQIPKTIVKVVQNLDAKIIIIQSIHTYPHEGVYVKSQSTIMF